VGQEALGIGVGVRLLAVEAGGVSRVTDAWLYVVAVLLIVAVPFDWIVAGIFIGAAIVKPRLRILNLAALRSTAIAIAATIAGLLGVQSILFGLYGVRLFPTPIPTILIAVALIVISLPNIYALRVLVDEGEER
jgi:hypothetical protein